LIVFAEMTSRSVRRRAHDCFGGEISVGPRPVLEHEHLTETLEQPLSGRAAMSDPLPAACPTLMRTGPDG